jgi:hypothetical protein
MRLEGFFSISRNAEEKLLPFAPMLGHRAATQETFAQIPEMKAFLDRHMPIAFDHSGNDLWIDRDTGRIFFMDWDEYHKGPVEIASSFGEFVSKFWVQPPTGAA